MADWLQVLTCSTAESQPVENQPRLQGSKNGHYLEVLVGRTGGYS